MIILHQYKIVICNLCETKTQLCLINKHKFEECTQNSVICGSCNETMTARDLKNHKNNVCSHRIVKCPDCSVNYYFYNGDEHMYWCPNKKVTCNICYHENISCEDLEDHFYENPKMHMVGIYQRMEKMIMMINKIAEKINVPKFDE